MIRKIIAIFILNCATVFATDAPASVESIKEVLSVTEVKSMLEKMGPQLDQIMISSMQQSLKGRVVSEQEQKTLDEIRAKMIASMKKELSWEKMEPLYIEIYQKSLTQSEIDGMLDFYKSPAGKAMVKKMPVIMQETMTAMQARMGPMMQRMRKDIQESVEKLKTQEEK